jgi:hypothetical protein
MKEALELLLTVNHYKYVLKFCNIKHEPPLLSCRKQEAGVNRLDCNIIRREEPALIVRSGKFGVWEKRRKTDY